VIHAINIIFVGFKKISQFRICLAREMGTQDALEN
jgi:hypothetical protein